MKLEKIGLIVLCFAFVVFSCQNDDGGNNFTEEEIRDRAEQQALDIVTLEDYLKTHYYNKSSFEGNNDPKIADLQIKSTEGLSISENADSLLINAVGAPKTSPFADITYEYYVLTLNEGGSNKSPSIADNVVINYEGFLLDNRVFDSAITPVNFDLTNLIVGWGKVLSLFNTSGSGPMENGDGTFSYSNNGVGVMFLPSGLAYFNAPPAGIIEPYTPIAFKFELFDTSENDHDNDGIPSYKEDLNNNGFVRDDNTDEDLDPRTGIPIYNYLDSDDDGDGVPTANEDIDGDGDPTNDIGKNGKPKYLDPEETESNV
ncbi:FKBP-type peptidyl-prolyl cis-trans isomerase [Seonamhaeicola sp. ML3]|uniref:FKBP-type peptidyl-prolyl cis-trans isomerase n=1 Tax=Seonamhaeicola sp. ML3 TaxID=2937786 RepID=UPI00200C638C|nr:hypothetical protein [Seonamhaeicola sp. ML3]